MALAIASRDPGVQNRGGSQVKLLIRGAVKSYGNYNQAASEMSVIVFHHKLTAREWSNAFDADELRMRLSILTFRNDVTSARAEVENPLLQDCVRPLAFRFDELDADLICEWIGPKSSAIRDKLARVVKGLKARPNASLSALVEEVQGLDIAKRAKTDIAEALRQQVEPLLVGAGETSALEQCAPGKVVVVDCGRFGTATQDDRTRAWLTLLAALMAATRKAASSQNYLLVLDELNEAFPAAPRSRFERKLFQSMCQLDNKGRHFGVNWVLASQSPSHFLPVKDFADSATSIVVLKLAKGSDEYPGGRLWKQVKRQMDGGTFDDLQFGNAWYCASGSGVEPEHGAMKVN